MLIDPGHHLGDAWFAVDHEVVHALYLRCPESTPRHTRWEIARATSTDLMSWELHGPVITPTADEPCLATGSVVRDGEGWLLAFTIGWAEPVPRIGLARSADLIGWTREGDGPALPAEATHGSPDGLPHGRPATHWRDPFLRHRSDGTLEALLCASRPDRPEDRSGAVAIARRAPSGRWGVGPPLDVEAVARELECPQVVEVDGGWFLVFSTWPALFADDLRRVQGDRLRPGTYAMAGTGPDGPFRLEHPEPIVPAHQPQQPYAAQVVTVEGGHHLLGTLWRAGAPDAVSDPIPVRRVGDRLLADEPIRPGGSTRSTR